MRVVLAGFLLSALAAPAFADASFDCAKAGTAVEKEICKDANYDLGERDKVLARLYVGLKRAGGHDAVLKQQGAWLKKRDACGPKPECLSRRYDERIAELAEAAGDEAHVTGTYSYSLAEDTDFGTAFVARMADGNLTAMISTVSGPTFHICELSFDGARPHNSGWQWVDSEEAYEGGHCTVNLLPGRDTLAISSENCSLYCGARGFFDQTYRRAE